MKSSFDKDHKLSKETVIINKIPGKRINLHSLKVIERNLDMKNAAGGKGMPLASGMVFFSASGLI